jgi:hypothetical protein
VPADAQAPVQPTPATPPVEAQPATPPAAPALPAPTLGAAYVVLPRAALGPYGTFEAQSQPAWDLSHDPELVAAHGQGRDSVLVLRCDCGKIIRMLGHEIAADGTVSPSVWHDVPGCGWHVFARLEGWEQGTWHAGRAR